MCSGTYMPFTVIDHSQHLVNWLSSSLCLMKLRCSYIFLNWISSHLISLLEWSCPDYSMSSVHRYTHTLHSCTCATSLKICDCVCRKGDRWCINQTHRSFWTQKVWHWTHHENLSDDTRLNCVASDCSCGGQRSKVPNIPESPEWPGEGDTPQENRSYQDISVSG